MGDWRLPTEQEWDNTISAALVLKCSSHGANEPPSLTDTAVTECYADETSHIFTNVESGNTYRSSTKHTQPSKAYDVDLYNGYVPTHNMTPAVYGVWPVRSGQ